MMPSLVRSARLVATGLLLAGCSLPRMHSGPSPEAIAGEWTVVLDQAGQEVQAGRYASADQLLLGFQQHYPSAPQSGDASFFRALYKLDPANTTASSHDASVLLDAALSAPAPATRRADALALRRIAAALEAKPSVVTVVVPGKETPAASSRADAASKEKDEEIARLKEDVAKANAELERIRRRLATPKP